MLASDSTKCFVRVKFGYLGGPMVPMQPKQTPKPRR